MLVVSELASKLNGLAQSKETKGGTVTFRDLTRKSFKIAHPSLKGNALRKSYDSAAFEAHKIAKKQAKELIENERTSVLSIAVNSNKQSGLIRFGVTPEPEVAPEVKTMQEAAKLGIDVAALVAAAKKAEAATIDIPSTPAVETPAVS